MGTSDEGRASHGGGGAEGQRATSDPGDAAGAAGGSQGVTSSTQAGGARGRAGASSTRRAASRQKPPEFTPDKLAELSAEAPVDSPADGHRVLSGTRPLLKTAQPV